MIELDTELLSVGYPGRVLVLARTTDANLAVLYALTGRSESSKQRQIRQVSEYELRVEATDNREHDSLRHYVAGYSNDRWTLLGNGEQVGEVFHRLETGMSPSDALDRLSYESDPPIYTPRITTVVDRCNGTAWLGAARRSLGQRSSADITITIVRDLAPGDAVLLSTYASDGTDVCISPAVRDCRTVAGGRSELLNEVWNSLDPDYVVAAAIVDPLLGVDAVLRHA